MEKSKILVIEDNHDMRENIVELLELSNYNVFDADNAKEGVKKALEIIPNLIICDIMMPGIDGYETLYLLSKNPETASIPFVFLTAKSEKEDFRKGMDLGADDYLTKPFEEMDLLNTIERRLKKYEQLNQTRLASTNSFLTAAGNYLSIESLIQNKKSRKYSKKENIFREGDFPHYLFMIHSGQVKTFKINEDGKEFIHQILGKGDFLGQIALMQDISHTEFAEALEDTELLLIPRQDFQSLVYQNREIAGQFIKMLAKEITEKEKELLHLAYDTVRKRTADSLAMLSEKGNTLEINISRDDLSNLVGTATESVIRILSEFKKDGTIVIKNGMINIVDLEKLKSIKY